MRARPLIQRIAAVGLVRPAHLVLDDKAAAAQERIAAVIAVRNAQMRAAGAQLPVLVDGRAQLVKKALMLRIEIDAQIRTMLAEKIAAAGAKRCAVWQQQLAVLYIV